MIVVDASVIVKWFVPEVHSAAARKWLDASHDYIAPDLMFPEVGNTLWKKVREGELAPEDAQRLAFETVGQSADLPSFARGLCVVVTGAVVLHVGAIDVLFERDADGQYAEKAVAKLEGAESEGAAVAIDTPSTPSSRWRVSRRDAIRCDCATTSASQP